MLSTPAVAYWRNDILGPSHPFSSFVSSKQYAVRIKSHVGRL